MRQEHLARKGGGRMRLRSVLPAEGTRALEGGSSYLRRFCSVASPQGVSLCLLALLAVPLAVVVAAGPAFSHPPAASSLSGRPQPEAGLSPAFSDFDGDGIPDPAMF